MRASLVRPYTIIDYIINKALRECHSTIITKECLQRSRHRTFLEYDKSSLEKKKR